MANTNIIPTTAPATFKSAVSAATTSLLADLKAAGIDDLNVAKAFADKYAPISTKWALNLTNAKLTNNTDDVEEYEELLAGVAALVVANAADAAILAEKIMGEDVEKMLLTASQAAVTSLIALV